MLRQSLLVPVIAVALVAVTLALGYRYADLTHHRKPPPTPTPRLSWPGTTVVRGILTGYSQRVMSIRSGAITYAVVMAQSTVVLPTCGRRPTLRPGEALEVRVPVGGNGDLLASMVRLAGPCTRSGGAGAPAPQQ